MAQSDGNTGANFEWVGDLLQGWNPYLAAGVLVVIALVWQSPAIITAMGVNRREGKKNDIEVAGRKKLFDTQYRSLEDKRKRKRERAKK
tara:strand:- start:4689 stop:4955 length:267 start_codon:yes stop_codon:yes gene_type:complete